MPLFQIGYRRYEGQRTSHALRWWPITRTGITIAWRSKLLRRLVYASFLPFLYFGWVFFVIGRITDPSTDPSGPFFELARNIFGQRIVNQLHEDPTLVRSTAWAMVFATFGTVVQLLMIAVVAAIVGSPLVATDQRSRAFLIYFARPISRLDYVIGKTGIVVALLAAGSLLPSLFLYLLSILFSPSLATVVQTAPVALTIVLASLGAIVPAALIILALSSLTRQPRFATATWFVICFFGPIAHMTLRETRGLRDSSWTFLLSLPHTVRALELGLYDIKGRSKAIALEGDLADMASSLTSPDSPALAAAWLGLLSVVSVMILLRRVDAPTQI